MSATHLTTATGAFDKGAIMRRAFVEGRHSLPNCRTIAERRALFGRCLKRAWVAARDEVVWLRKRAEYAVGLAKTKAGLQAKGAAIAATYGNDPDAIRAAIVSEQHRDFMDGARLDDLKSALASLDASLASIAASEDITRYMQAAE